MAVFFIGYIIIVAGSFFISISIDRNLRLKHKWLSAFISLIAFVISIIVIGYSVAFIIHHTFPNQGFSR